MKTHRILTFLGAVLLAATVALQYGQDGGSDLAYVTGVAMLVALAGGLVLFNKERAK